VRSPTRKRYPHRRRRGCRVTLKMEAGMPKSLKAGSAYFAPALAAGFVLGTARTLLLVPRIEETGAPDPGEQTSVSACVDVNAERRDTLPVTSTALRALDPFGVGFAARRCVAADAARWPAPPREPRRSGDDSSAARRADLRHPASSPRSHARSAALARSRHCAFFDEARRAQCDPYHPPCTGSADDPSERRRCVPVTWL
jgi:hypothetical protein